MVVEETMSSQLPLLRLFRKSALFLGSHWTSLLASRGSGAARRRPLRGRASTPDPQETITHTPVHILYDLLTCPMSCT